MVVGGLVQGVAFRMRTQREAGRLELTGWVRNLADGRVEAVFEGESDAVEKMLAWCRSGPPSARVEQFDVKFEEPAGERGFSIRY